MHIKQIIIEGFKSYRERTVVGPFDTRHNAVVGRNGSGKSNFFNAIQFVLSDEYAHLNTQQRQNLLHEGFGPKIIKAYVEIILDNSDDRIFIKNREGEKEISLRREIGAKTDQYFINKKKSSRNEIVNLLEQAGFSCDNPYYIVKQGKIMQLATAPDTYRLKLLREVAGIKMYDEHKFKYLVLFKDSEEKIVKIRESYRTKEEQLSRLEKEKEKLKQYQLDDQIRRALEYVIQKTLKAENKKKLIDLKCQRDQSGSEQQKLAEKLNVAQETIKTLTKKIKEINKELRFLKEERDILSIDYQHLIKQKTKLDFDIKDLSEELQGDKKSKEQAENELARLTEKIKKKEAELEKIKPLYEEMKAREEECSRELALKEQKRNELYAKHGRGSQFKSKEDRDRWIKNELESLNKQIKNKKDYKDELEGDLKTRDAQKIEDMMKKMEEQGQQLERQKDYIDDYNKHCDELKKSKDQHQATKNELSRKESTVQINLSSLKSDLRKTDEQLKFLMGKAIWDGLDSLRKVLDTFLARGGKDAEIVKGCYGSVIENFECEKNMYIAVDVTAGNGLFYQVVENDQVATMILKELNRQKLPGVVNFMALNRLDVHEQHYPPPSPDAVPMVSKLTYDQKYDKIFKYLFGKILVCRNWEVATESARNFRLDCVTLDGDHVSSKGALTGGFFNPSRSRLQTQKNRTETISQIQQCERELQSLEKQLAQTEANSNAIVTDLQKIEIKNNKAKDIYDNVKVGLRLMQEELSNIEKLQVSKERSLSQCKLSLESMQTTKESLESELHQDLSSSLSEADQQQVDSLNDDIQKLQKENKDASNTRMMFETEKNKLDNLLSNNLIRRRNYLWNNLQEISEEDRIRKLNNCKTKVEEIDQKIEKVNKELSIIETKLKEMENDLKHEQSVLEKCNRNKKECQEQINEKSKNLEKYALKQYLLEEEIEKSAEKIKQMGALPPQDLYHKYIKMPINVLFKQLDEINAELKKLIPINMKAVDQFVSLSDEMDKLKKSLEKVEKGKEGIARLIDVLDHRKVEAIHTTFKQVCKYFTEVYKKLEPNWNAKLVLYTIESDEGRDITPQDTNVDVFTGMGVRITFIKEGVEVEIKEINQLSAGQKTMVALALILAIQKCNLVPFYLFDEIDCALDKERRETLANVIHELSSSAQFIITTFRPELLVHAHKCFAVKFQNMASHFESVTREFAREFVELDPTHG